MESKVRRGILFGVLIIIVSACSKTTPQPVTPVSTMGFFHAAPNEKLVNVFMDNTQINSTSFEYASYSGSITVPSGDRVIKFTSVASGSKLVDTTVHLIENKSYTLYLIYKQSSTKTLATLDEGTLTNPTTDVMIRFVHLSSDTPAAYVVLTGETSPFFTPQTFQQSSAFKEVISKSYSFEVRASIDSHVIATASVVPKAGFYYTIVLLGLSSPPAGGSGKVSAQVVSN